jgi:hypothetical protein
MNTSRGRSVIVALDISMSPATCTSANVFSFVPHMQESNGMTQTFPANAISDWKYYISALCNDWPMEFPLIHTQSLAMIQHSKNSDT